MLRNFLGSDRAIDKLLQNCFFCHQQTRHETFFFAPPASAPRQQSLLPSIWDIFAQNL
ncbi:MAG: hypothetical protein SVX43_14015 [Cyanobacteriota bacterium]|nr:hypothetical protein [Cyanobacteriota bacterium]